MARSASLGTPPTDLEAQFAARGRLAEHPAAFRALLVGAATPFDAGPGFAIYHEGDE